MTAYTVEVPEAEELGIRVTCTEHDVTEEFRPDYRRVEFYCERCGHEVTVDVRAADDWRDLGEMC